MPCGIVFLHFFLLWLVGSTQRHSALPRCLVYRHRPCSLGCNVNAADYDGRTCLHVAASAGNKLIVSALLEAGGGKLEPKR